MHDTDRPPSMLKGKRNPAYTAWRKAQKAADAERIAMGYPEREDTETLDDIIDAAPESPPETETFTLIARKTAKNSYFVMADSPDEEGCCVPVKLLKKGSGPKWIKKAIKVERVNGNYFQVR